MGKGGEENTGLRRNYEIYQNSLFNRLLEMRGIERELDELYSNFMEARTRTLTDNNAINHFRIEERLRNILIRRGNSGIFTRNELKNLLYI